MFCLLLWCSQRRYFFSPGLISRGLRHVLFALVSAGGPHFLGSTRYTNLGQVWFAGVKAWFGFRLLKFNFRHIEFTVNA
jgi:hypothetical protein